jgi:ectoine hydroxylase-related dioxygenase (phytanoyl-CoA dioxygenase family)
MTGHFILTDEQIAEFDRHGILRVPGLLAAETVGAARDQVQMALSGAWKGEAKLSAVAALIDEPRLLEAVDLLLEGCAFDRELFKRPQVLFTPPNADRWTAPTGWHVDSPRLPSGRRPGVQLFAFLDTVEPGGGGTLAVTGSHRLLNQGRVILARELRRRLRREHFFGALYSATQQDRAGLLRHIGAVGDVALRVVEFTGAPGDAYLMDLRVLHAVAPNVTERPRMMATHRFWRADIIPELAQAYGWT